MTRRKATVSRAVTFTALDRIETAIIDMQGSAFLFDQIVTHGQHFDDAARAMHDVNRLMQLDSENLRAAFDKAHKAIKGSKREKDEDEDEGANNVVPLARPEPEGGAT